MSEDRSHVFGLEAYSGINDCLVREDYTYSLKIGTGVNALSVVLENMQKILSSLMS